MHTGLELALLLLASALVGSAAFRALRLPPMMGYVMAGIVLGPGALGVVPDQTGTRSLAEFGVVFLMFSIGLEFSLGRLKLMRGLVFGLGGLQVLLTMIAAAFAAEWFDLTPMGGFAVGGALAMSSTAIVSKLLAERGELESGHGRQIMGVLLFQDLAVVPLLILIPALGTNGGSGSDIAAALLPALAKAAIALLLILFLGQRLMRPWLHLVARSKSSELFMLNVLLITLGLAWATGQAGLSLALGAFLAGTLISETEFRYQVESDIRPFRDVLLGLFFITVGMLFDLREVAAHWLNVLATLALLIGGKGAIAGLLAWVFSRQPKEAFRTGLALAQAGEFGFVLLGLIDDYRLIPEAHAQIYLAAMVLSMLLAPILVQHSERLAQRITGGAWTGAAHDMTAIAVKAFAVRQHVILCGYGRSGQGLARLLAEEQVPFIALDHDPQRVRVAAAAGDNVVFGDSSRDEVLLAAGLRRASVVAISFSNTATALKIIAAVQRIRPDIPVIVRTVDETDLEKLRQAGATEVIPEVLEGALMLASQTLLMAGRPLAGVLRRIRQTREARYSSMRGFFSGLTDADSEPLSQERLRSFRIEPRMPAVGKTLPELELEAAEIVIVSLRRAQPGIPDEAPLTAGDNLILRGTQEALAAAELRLGVR